MMSLGCDGMMSLGCDGLSHCPCTHLSASRQRPDGGVLEEPTPCFLVPLSVPRRCAAVIGAAAAVPGPPPVLYHNPDPLQRYQFGAESSVRN